MVPMIRERGARRAHGPKVLALTSLAVLTACAWPERPLVVALSSELAGLDPHTHDELVSWSLLSNFYDGLVRFSPTMELEPCLATSWEAVDARTTRFHLRPGVRFHDGSLLDAEDVAASFRRARRLPNSGMAVYLRGIVDVRAEGKLAVVVETDAPAPTLANRLAYLFVVPRHQERLATIHAPVGTGPYRFVGQDEDGSVQARAFKGWRPRPPVRSVRFVAIDEETDRVRKFVAGEVDVALAVPDESLPEIARAGGRRVLVQPTLAVRVLAVVPHAASGTARLALADARVRRAMLLALDRQRLVEEVLQGHATVASQYVHPVVFGYDPSLAPLLYDPPEARRLLAEAGFADGFEVDLGHGHIPESLVAWLVGGLAEVGIRARPVAMPFATLLRRARDGRLPLVLYARSCMSGDAAEFLDATIHSPVTSGGFGSENFHGYASPAVDALLEQAEGETDRERRRSLLQEAQRRALVDLPVLPLVVPWQHMGCRAGLEVVPRHDGWLWVAGIRLDR